METMGMQIDHQKIKQTRITKGWTQQQLSEICGLSVRTIQRVENQQHASMETLSTLSSVFDIRGKSS